MTDDVKRALALDIKFIVDSEQDFRVTRTDLVNTLRQSPLHRRVEFPFPHRWRLGAWFINQCLDDIASMKVDVVKENGHTYYRRRA
jgi:hypothetical protein